MKKYLAILTFCFAAFMVSAQSTSPRFGTLKNQDNTGRVVTYGYVAPAYAATVALVPKWYDTSVKVGTLTGNLILTASVTNSFVGDKLEIILVTDETNRVVTFSTGFASGGATVIAASTSICYNFSFNGVAWVHSSKNYIVTATGLNVPGNIITTTTNIQKRTATAINSTGTATTAAILGGLITSTSAAATTITLPTATELATAAGATQGTTIDFLVDNSAGANTVTVAVGTGITASGFPGTNTLTLAQSATVGVAGFRITFISATAATLTRIN